jgi:multiple sugar transport system substrate-binding protein
MKMVYNREIFAKAGITATPRTWAEMVDVARRITQAGNGEFYGFGWSTMWPYSWTRLAMEANVHNTGASFFNTNTGTFDFRPFKPAIEALAQMYQQGSMFPTPMDQHIDPIRNRFAEGRVGMEVAPAYDISVYNVQFPSNFDWGVFDVPTFQPGPAPYKGMALNRCNVSISSRVSNARMPAVAAAFEFLHSEYFYGKLYANSAIIPHEASIIASTRMEKALKNWDVMSDTTNFLPAVPNPQNLVTLEGDDVFVTCDRIMLGRTTFDAEVDALNRRYNEGYQRAKAQGIVDPKIFEFTFSFR